MSNNGDTGICFRFFSGLVERSRKQEFIRTGKDLELQATAYVEWIKLQITQLRLVIAGGAKFVPKDTPGAGLDEIFFLSAGTDAQGLLELMQRRLKRARTFIFDGIVAQNDTQRALAYLEDKASVSADMFDHLVCDRWLRALCNDNRARWDAEFIGNRMALSKQAKPRWEAFRAFLQKFKSNDLDDEGRDLAGKVMCLEDAFRHIFGSPVPIATGPKTKPKAQKSPARKP